MGVLTEAPRGGLAEELAGTVRPLLLRNGEIERFEDAHCGIFEVWDGFMGRGKKPGAVQVRDLIALALVGGGMAEDDAGVLVNGLGPGENLRLYELAQGVLGIAFLPDMIEADERDLAEAAAAEEPKKKRIDPGDGVSEP